MECVECVECVGGVCGCGWSVKCEDRSFGV